jgi:hypothetical protein
VPALTCLVRFVACRAGLFKTQAAAQAFCDKLSVVQTPPLADRLAGIEEGVNTFFLTINGALVFVMHAGFAMVSAVISDTSNAGIAPVRQAHSMSCLCGICGTAR